MKSHVQNSGSEEETHHVLEAGGHRKRQIKKWACFWAQSTLDTSSGDIALSRLFLDSPKKHKQN